MDGPFRLMTANLLNGRADAGHLARILDRVEPDLVMTQELGPDAAQAIAERYPHHDLRPGLDHRGRGIASRFDAEFGSVDLGWRSGSWGRVDIDGRSLLVATVHLLNPVDFPWWVTARRRGRQLDALFSWMDGVAHEGPFILAGDMNASPKWPVYRRLNARWKDLVAEAGRISEITPAPTWGWRPGWPRVLRIDHVLGAGVEALAAGTEMVTGSDHAAVVVDLQFL
ncbi:MAG: endonuclease/exonuclease/phosphatase family protein [Acidimicrobiia bacterium]